MSNDGKQEPKGRARLDALEQKVAELSDALAKQAGTIDALRAALDEANVKITDLRKQLEEQVQAAADTLDEIRQHGGLQLTQAATLDAEDLAELLEQDPGRRLICVTGSSQLGLRPGEAFDPRHKFSTAQQAVQFARGGVRFAPAPV